MTDVRRRYENYLSRAKAKGWDDQAEHWQSLIDALEDEDENIPPQ